MLPIFQIFPNFLQQCSVKTKQGSGSQKDFHKSRLPIKIYFLYIKIIISTCQLHHPEFFKFIFPIIAYLATAPLNRLSVHEGVNYVISIYVTHPQDAMLVFAYSYICK